MMADDAVDIKLFIKTVEKYEAVWNRDSDAYKDQRIRETAWQDIANETHSGDVRRAKIKWKKLRDCHRDALKRRWFNIKEGKKNQKWKHQSLMQFLIPHMHNSATDSTYLERYNDVVDQDLIEDYNSDNEKLVKLPKKVKQEIVKNPLDCDDDDVPIIEYIDHQDSDKKWSEKGDELNNDNLDPLDHFFASVCQTTKRLPLAAQLRLKRKIMNLVIEEEELNLESVDQGNAFK